MEKKQNLYVIFLSEDLRAKFNTFSAVQGITRHKLHAFFTYVKYVSIQHEYYTEQLMIEITTDLWIYSLQVIILYTIITLFHCSSIGTYIHNR